MKAHLKLFWFYCSSVPSRGSAANFISHCKCGREYEDSVLSTVWTASLMEHLRAVMHQGITTGVGKGLPGLCLVTLVKRVK